jgi:hypothetical protein
MYYYFYYYIILLLTDSNYALSFLGIFKTSMKSIIMGTFTMTSTFIWTMKTLREAMTNDSKNRKPQLRWLNDIIKLLNTTVQSLVRIAQKRQGFRRKKTSAHHQNISHWSRQSYTWTTQLWSQMKLNKRIFVLRRNWRVTFCELFTPDTKLLANATEETMWALLLRNLNDEW